MTILGIVALSFIVVILVVAWTDKVDSACTGDCNQGRNCTCGDKNESA